MTTKEIANRLFELCHKGDYTTAHKELYAANATSTESDMKGGRPTVTGLAALEDKAKRMQDATEVLHSRNTTEPKVYGNYIFMEMGMDITMKGMGRMNMQEIAKYEVKDGKIISEEFFY